jgi:hypothetical protein
MNRLHRMTWRAKAARAAAHVGLPLLGASELRAKGVKAAPDRSFLEGKFQLPSPQFPVPEPAAIPELGFPPDGWGQGGPGGGGASSGSSVFDAGPDGLRKDAPVEPDGPLDPSDPQGGTGTTGLSPDPFR